MFTSVWSLSNHIFYLVFAEHRTMRHGGRNDVWISILFVLRTLIEVSKSNLVSTIDSIEKINLTTNVEEYLFLGYDA
jgi:hypothetical protein